MKKVYKLIDLDCAVCGNKIEEALNKEEFVKKAKVNFINKELIIEYNDNKKTYLR